MNKIIRSTIVITAFLFFFTSIIAEAVEVKFGGQMRPRYNLIDHKGSTGFEKALPPEEFWDTRIRLNTEIVLDENNSGFIQFQGIGIYGLGTNTGGSRLATTPNDTAFDVGFHQAYFKVKNLLDVPVDLQVGRQEVVLDGHRLVGNVGWNQGGRSHDAIRLSHSKDNLSVSYIYSKTQESEANFQNLGIGTDHGDDLDFQAHILWNNYKGLLGENSSTSGYFIYVDQGNANPDTLAPIAQGLEADSDIYTIGFRQAGKLVGLDYRGEFYYQFGKAENYTGFGANTLGYAGYNVASKGAGTSIDRQAYMFGLRVGKRFADIPWKPSLTIWYDHLSGTDQDDVNNNNFSTFATLFATMHKFYGHMDLFMVSGIFGNGRSVKQLGLRDLAIKTSVQPTTKLLFKADWHWFWTDTDLSDPDNAPLANSLGVCACDRNLGQELDLTMVYRYNSFLTYSMGYSHYFATQLFRNINLFQVLATTDDDGDWAFAQFDWKF